MNLIILKLYFLKLQIILKENKIENLMNYGNDYDEGLLHLSSLYKNLLMN